MYQISVETDNFHFLNKLAEKGYFQPKADAKNTAFEFYISN